MIVERRKRWMPAILLILGIGNIVIMDVTRMDNLEENTWTVFKNLRDFARKTVYWKSNCNFYQTCIQEDLRIKGLRSKNLLGFGDSKLFETCNGFYREADAKVTKEAYKFAMRRKNELFIEFYGWKRELFRTGELEKGKELWDRVKREMSRNTDKCERTKSKKLEKLRTEKEREDGLKKELNGEDIMKSKEKRKELGLKTRVDDRKTRRTRKRVRKRNNKKSNQKRKERRKREIEQFRESMKDVSRRTAEEMINVKDFSESDLLLFGKGQKFVPTPKRVDLVKKHEDFLEFNRKLRLKVYFHNRDVENGGESDHISVREHVGEDLEFEFVDPTPWKKNSEFEPQAGETRL